MSDEPLGIIYRITTDFNPMEYHGLSVDSLADRKKGHKHGAKVNADGGSAGCRKLYNAMNAHGFEHFKFEVIEYVPISQLGIRETFWITSRNSLHPNGYNLTTGGDNHQHNEETKQLISLKCKKHPLSVGLPMYVTHKPRNRYESFRITEHPLCKHKEFSGYEYGSTDAAKTACLEWLKQLENNGVKYVPVPNKKDPTKRPGISTLKNGGLRVGKTFNGKLYEKVFQDMSWTEERRLAAANAELDRLIAEHSKK